MIYMHDELQKKYVDLKNPKIYRVSRLKKSYLFLYVKNVTVYRNSKKATIKYITNTKSFVFTLFFYILL